MNVTGFTAECHWGIKKKQTLNFFDQYVMKGLRDYDAPRGRTMRFKIDTQNMTRLPHRFIGKPLDSKKGIDTQTAIDGAGKWAAETLNFRKRYTAPALSEGKKRKNK